MGGSLCLQGQGVGDPHPSPFLNACPRVCWVTEGWTATFTEDLTFKKRSRRIQAESLPGLQEEKRGLGQSAEVSEGFFFFKYSKYFCIVWIEKEVITCELWGKKMYLARKRYSGNGYYNYSLKQRERHLTQHRSAGRRGPCSLPSSLCSGLFIPGPSSNMYPKADGLTALTAGCLPCSSLTQRTASYCSPCFFFLSPFF